MIVFGTMEATLTPLMQEIEARFRDVKVFSLPSVDHPEYGQLLIVQRRRFGQQRPAAGTLAMAGVLGLRHQLVPVHVEQEHLLREAAGHAPAGTTR